jgi:hypothetical protein
LPDLSNPGTIAVFKILLVIIAGLLAAVAVFSDQKRKERLTRLQKLTLAGVMLSTVVGLITEIISANRERENDDKQHCDTLTVLRQLQRLLSPADDPRANVAIEINCTGDVSGFCQAVKVSQLSSTSQIQRATNDVWQKWPVAGIDTQLLVTYSLVDIPIGPNDPAHMNKQNYHWGAAFRGSPTGEQDQTATCVITPLYDALSNKIYIDFDKPCKPFNVDNNNAINNNAISSIDDFGDFSAQIKVYFTGPKGALGSNTLLSGNLLASVSFHNGEIITFKKADSMPGNLPGSIFFNGKFEVPTRADICH